MSHATPEPAGAVPDAVGPETTDDPEQPIPPLRALALVCTLTPRRPRRAARCSPVPSSATRTAPTTSAGLLVQTLDDVGFPLPANAVTCWNDEVEGEARDHEDLPRTPEGVATVARTVAANAANAANAAHLARLLEDAGHPAAGGVTYGRARDGDHPRGRTAGR